MIRAGLSALVIVLSLSLVRAAPAPSDPPVEKKASAASEAWNPVTYATVLAGIPKAYYDPRRLPPKRAFISGITRLERDIPELVVSEPDAQGAIRVTVKNQSRTYQSADLKTWMQMGDRLLDVLRFVDQRLARPEIRDKLQYAAIKGCLQVLDPHSVFYTPDEFKEQKSRFSGSLGGVGVMLTKRKKRIVIREVIPEGPAAKAGLKAGDWLLKVNDLSLTNLTPVIAAARLRGKPGTQVTVVVKRGRRTLTIRLTRAEIVVPSVEARMLRGRVALVTITGFPKNALEGFQKAVTKLKEGRPRAWILDLRGNEGGYIQQAARMADSFLASGLLCKAVGLGGQKVVTWNVKPRADRIENALVILTDRRTASAAEILAGALAVADRALIIGERTWGKGTVQKLFTDFKDQSALKLTMWQYLLRGDIPIQSAAIVPDIELVPVELSPGKIRYLTAAEAEREASHQRRISAMTGQKAWQGRPVVKELRYLAIGHHSADTVLELARKISIRAKGNSRKALLRRALPVVQSFRKQQDQAIQRQLGEQGIDWSPAGQTKPRLSAKLTIKPAKVSAGQRVELALTVTNIGTNAAHRVGAVFSAFHRMINHRELLFGKLAPGESRTRSLKVQIPAGLHARWELVQVAVRAASRANLAHSQVMLAVASQDRPRFRLQWLLDDRASGDGDGVLDRGETADLVVWAQNEGKGTAEEVRVDGTDPEGELTVVRARALFPKMPAGAIGSARLAVKCPAKARQGKRKPTLVLTVYDETLGGDLSHRITLPVWDSPAKFKPTTRYVSPTSNEIRFAANTDPDAPLVARVSHTSRLRVEAEHSLWRRVRLPGKRFAFVSATDLKQVDGPVSITGLDLVWQVVPPEIQIWPTPAVAAGDKVLLKGLVRSKTGVRDLWIRVWNPQAKDRQVNKVRYLASKKGGATQLSFETSVPLQPGTNYISVDARDMHLTRGQHRVAVYRPLPEDRVTPRPGPTPMKAEQKRKGTSKKKGCGCQTGDPVTGLMVVTLFLITLCWLLGRPARIARRSQ